MAGVFWVIVFFLEMPTVIRQLRKVYMLGVWISPPIATFLGTPVLVLIETSTFPIVVCIFKSSLFTDSWVFLKNLKRFFE